MAPGRRGRPAGSTNTRAAAPQSTLAFGRNNKITKPSLLQPPNKKASKPSSSDQQVKDVAKVVDEKVVATKQEEDGLKEEESKQEGETAAVKDEDPALAEGKAAAALAVRKKEEKEVREVDKDEERANKVSDAAVKRYWNAKEAERKSPRVHQRDMSTHEKILQHFDLSSQFGPCIGIPRERRWKRAKGLGMEPPIEVLAVLMKEKKDEAGEAGNVQKAFSVLG